MATLTQRESICSYDIAILALYTEGVERHPAKREQYAKAARCTLACRVSHYAGPHWDVVGSDGDKVYRVSGPRDGSNYNWTCDCLARVTCYHVYAVRLHIKAQARQIEEPPRYKAECKGVRGIETPLFAGQSHFAPDFGQAFFGPECIIERHERIN